MGWGMENYKRYAIYLAPEPGPLADFGAAWLGWDAATGTGVPHPDVAGLTLPIDRITATPRKYGFHGTIKPPFRLAEGQDIAALHAAATELARNTAPITLDGLVLSRLGRFLALTPAGDAAPLAALAATFVQELDGFRAPLSDAEIAKRNPARLSPAQRALLDRWGYPYVLGEFRFHLTLTGPLDHADAAATEIALAPLLQPLIAGPFAVNSLCLFGEAADGRFHNLHRYTLSG